MGALWRDLLRHLVGWTADRLESGDRPGEGIRPFEHEARLVLLALAAYQHRGAGGRAAFVRLAGQVWDNRHDWGGSLAIAATFDEGGTEGD